MPLIIIFYNISTYNIHVYSKRFKKIISCIFGSVFLSMLPYNGAVEYSCSILIKNATQKCNDKQIMQSI